MQMPGWTNIWTLPIQNRIDMLSTGVNTTVGIRVLGRRLGRRARRLGRVAAVVAKVPGAVNVVADRPSRQGLLANSARPRPGRPSRRPRRRRERTGRGRPGRQGGDANRRGTGAPCGARPLPARSGAPTRSRPASCPCHALGAPGRPVRLGDVADVRIVQGPETIKSENGLLRNYVRLNVRGRDGREFVEEARRIVAARVELPPGVFLEWTGQFEHEAARPRYADLDPARRDRP